MNKQIAEPRPLLLQREVERRYPKVWDVVANIRKDRGNIKGMIQEWADWCYLPLAVWYVISENLTEKQDSNVPWSKANLIAAVGTWRLGKGIYRFDPDLYTELIDTPITDDMPVEMFFRLPEYCIYIETPGITYRNKAIYGFFTFLDDNKNNDKCPRLNIVYDGGPSAFVLTLNIPNGGDFKTEFEKMYFNEKRITTAVAKEPGSTKETILDYVSSFRELAMKTLPLLLYLCTDEPDYGDRRPPVYAAPKKIKGGDKWFAAPGINNWDVGVRIGATIRMHCEQKSTRELAVHGSGRAPVRPHMRRAHWHGYWTGKRSEPLKRKYVLHWIPPTPIKMHDTDAPAVIRPVKK